MPKEYINSVKQSDSGHGEVLFSWTFTEFPDHQRDISWFIGAGIIAFIFLIFSIVSGNLLFAILVIIFPLVMLLVHRHVEDIEFKITEDGIMVKNHFYSYKDLKNFFIIYLPPEVKTLYFEPGNVFKPRIPIPLQDQNPIEIRETLLKYMSEDLDRDNEPLSDQIFRMFKM